MLEFDIKYFLRKESGYQMIFLSSYFYFKKKKIMLFLEKIQTCTGVQLVEFY